MRALGLTVFAPTAAALVIVACSSDGGSITETKDGGSSTAAPTVDAVLANYSANLYAAYGDAVTDQATFDAQLQTFLGAPTDDALASLRTAWLASRAHYMLTEGARFYSGPIDADDGNPEAFINSWPLDEAYIDYTTNKATNTVDETSGFINHPDLMATITVDAIDAANAQGGDDNISDGYHAEEFLLWGQALQDVGPGQRPSSDYLLTGSPRKNADRRQAYLKTSSLGITQHLTAVRDAWAPTADYRVKFQQGGLASVALALTGLGRFSKGELAGERINAPYASKSRRDQHDCFSSQTLVDYTRDAQGIQMIYMGTYGTNKGAAIADLVRAANPQLETQIETQIQQSITLMQAIPAPFEASIVGDDSAPGRHAILAVINSLKTQGDLFAQAAAALGQTIQVPDSND